MIANQRKEGPHPWFKSEELPFPGPSFTFASLRIEITSQAFITRARKTGNRENARTGVGQIVVSFSHLLVFLLVLSPWRAQSALSRADESFLDQIERAAVIAARSEPSSWSVLFKTVKVLSRVRPSSTSNRGTKCRLCCSFGRRPRPGRVREELDFRP